MLARFRPKPDPVPEQLTLDLDQPTDTGLPLRDAMTVRSAEFWLALGQPRLALKELEALNELARQNTWPMRVHLRANHAATTGSNSLAA